MLHFSTDQMCMNMQASSCFREKQALSDAGKGGLLHHFLVFGATVMFQKLRFG